MITVCELVSRYAGSKFRADMCSVSTSMYSSMISVSMENPIFDKYYRYTTNCCGCNNTSPYHTCKRVLEARLSVANKPRAIETVKIVSDYHIFVILKINVPFNIACKYACLDVVKILVNTEFICKQFNGNIYDDGVFNAIMAVNTPVVNYLLEHDPRIDRSKMIGGRISSLNSISMILI